MPPVRTARASKKAPPDGFEDLEDTLLEFQNKMKDAENASHEGKKKYEMTWPIFQITHQRSRYIYDMYYEKEAISKQLYDYLLKNGYADAMLIAKWKKQGYEKLCCTRCIQTKETNFRSTCICRVPKDQMKENQDIQTGCAGMQTLKIAEYRTRLHWHGLSLESIGSSLMHRSRRYLTTHELASELFGIQTYDGNERHHDKTSDSDTTSELQRTQYKKWESLSMKLPKGISNCANAALIVPS
ncbi:hypothetical protein OPT61_g1888 [Boeremia exigua]|uniref:Uncharacterized protein n=1 Tax=Boeremia exigua TaxID=749465 RepID=A0ACC2INQ9_9PLEO|nr:hypothetical protein OPT61_g1888 [Boeremia exigua]